MAASSRPMSVLPTDVTVDGFLFRSSILTPSSDKCFFLGGAGVRGIMTDGDFVKYTAIGVYIEQDAIASLTHKWKGNSVGELAKSVDFFRDIVTGPFEVFFQVSFIKYLSGTEFIRKVSENCIAICKALGTFTKAEEKAIQKFQEMFKDENFTPGCCVLYKQSPLGALTIAFGKHDAEVKEAVPAGVIENRPVSQAVLESIIGEDGVSPATRQSLAARLSEYMAADLKL